MAQEYAADKAGIAAKRATTNPPWRGAPLGRDDVIDVPQGLCYTGRDPPDARSGSSAVIRPRFGQEVRLSLNHSHSGHTHFLKVPITRRKFLGSAALAGGAALAAGAWWPELAQADMDELASVYPLPIPGGVTAFGAHIHHYPPVPLLGSGPINEPSAMTDFNGLVGVTRVLGNGTGTNTQTGATTRLVYQVDNGFNSGLYLGEDGRTHHGTFAFI